MLIRILAALLGIATSACVSTREVLSLGDPSPGPTSTSAETSHFICWNVHKASDEQFTLEVKDLLDALPKDSGVILCMQEVRSSTYDLIRNLHREEISGHYAPSWRFPFSRHSTGVLTVGNQPLPASSAVSLRASRRELLVASPKVSLLTETPLSCGRKLQIINCHGLNFVPFSVFKNQLDEIFAPHHDHDSPSIVCGDFNVWSEQRLDMLARKAAEVGLSEVHPHGPVDSPAPQWLRVLKRFNGFDPDIRLDRIYTRGIEVLGCRCHGESESSDHLPLILNYRILPAS